MSKSQLTNQLMADVNRYFQELGSNAVILSNELHLQMHLAQFLVREGYHLYYEYHVPTDRLKGNYPWLTRDGKPQEMYLDLVVYDKDEFVPIELKYKTLRLCADMLVFNKEEKGVDRLRNQGAQDLGMYAFWKDVYRLELVRHTYKAVKNGLAIFVTNDQLYCDRDEMQVKKNVNHFAFRMTNGRKGVHGVLEWSNKNSETAKRNPSFDLSGNYDVNWTPIGKHSSPRNNADFSYCMVTI